MRFLRWLTVGSVLLAMLLGVTAGRTASAQELCGAPHRSLSDLGRVLDERGDGESLPEAIPYAAPSGSPADGDTAAAVEALLVTMTECGNKGDIVGLLSLFTDAFIQRHFTLDTINAVPDGAYIPEPVPANQRMTLVELRDVTITGDGEVAALAIFAQEDVNTDGLTHLISFVKDVDVWLIDAVQPVTLTGGTSGEWQPVSGDEYEGVIVPTESVAEFVQWFSSAEIQGAWTPTSTQIATLEAALPAFLATSDGPQIADKLADYRRQYAGYVADGRALILVNAFCNETGSDWRSTPVFVLDGGDCFWSVVWDPSAGSFDRLSINGEA